MRRVLNIFCSSFLICMCFAVSARTQGINISLVGSHKPVQSGFGDVWGDGNLACMGVWLSAGYANGFGFGIYDISNPALPSLVSVYNYSANTRNRFEQGVITNQICYVGCWASGTSWAGSGLHILSLTNPASPVLLARITRTAPGTVTNGFDDVHTLFVERNFLYEAAHNINTVNVKVFDISNPSAPVYVRDIVTTNTTKVHQITVGNKGTNTILYTSGWGGNSDGNPNSFGQTDIWDVSNVGTQPAKWLGRIYSGYSSHSSWPTPDGNTLVICRETPGGDVSFYDISSIPNPSPTSTNNPTPIAVISPARMGIEGDIPHNPVIVSNLLFISWYQNGLQVFDITDRTKPVRIGSYDTYPGTGVTNAYAGNWGIYPKLGLNKLLVSDIYSGFFILDASAVLTATNNYPPMLVTQPISLIATQGLVATLPSLTTGSSIKYQWRFNNTILSGATNATLTFNSVQASNSGNYFVVASNSLGSVTSVVASLTVAVPAGSAPAVTGQPQNASVYAGNPASFSVAVTGAAPLNFQWRLNGGDIPGATNGSLSLPSVQPEQVGAYSVFISNNYGSTTSSNASLMIIDSPYLNSVQATPGARSALISWKSSVPSDSRVVFDVTSLAAQGASFGETSYIDRQISTNHTILLTGLAPDTPYSFQVISSDETNSYLSGVYQFTTAGTIILDNTDAVYTGSWTAGTSSLDKYGTNYQFATSSNSITATATYRPNLPTSGKYDVYVYYPQGGNRANNAPYTISFNGGTNTIPVNQQSGGGTWNLVASEVNFLRGTSGSVCIANNASPMVVMADAVRFVYVESQDFPVTATVPAWWENFYFGGPVNPLADADYDGYTTADEYILGTSPVNANSRLQLDLQAAGNAANITFWPLLGDRSYNLLYRTNVTDSTWQVLSAGSITPTPFGHGIFTISTADVGQGFYRLQVQPLIGATSFSGLSLARGEVLSGFGEAACGVNRIYVR